MGCQFSERAKHMYIIEILHVMNISKPQPPPYQPRGVSVLCTSAQHLGQRQVQSMHWIHVCWMRTKNWSQQRRNWANGDGMLQWVLWQETCSVYKQRATLPPTAGGRHSAGLPFSSVRTWAPSPNTYPEVKHHPKLSPVFPVGGWEKRMRSGPLIEMSEKQTVGTNSGSSESIRNKHAQNHLYFSLFTLCTIHPLFFKDWPREKGQGSLRGAVFLH